MRPSCAIGAKPRLSKFAIIIPEVRHNEAGMEQLEDSMTIDEGTEDKVDELFCDRLI
jgi:hypothetical protein